MLAALLALAGCDPDGPLTVPPDSGTPDDPGPDNVLLVVLDDVGIERLATYGVGDVHAVTPRIDALAAEGVTFRTVWGTPVCSPARAALLTGRYARRTGFGTVNPPEFHFVLDPAEVTIPELLRSAPVPYTDAAIGKWHLGDRQGDGLDHPLAAGFSAFSGSMNNLDESWGSAGGTWDYGRWQRNVDGTLDVVTRYATTQTTDEALEFVASAPEPWFLYLSYNAAHSPMTAPPAELFGGPWSDAAAPEQQQRWVLEALDTELGRLLDALDPEERARTTIVVVGDNGTPDFATTGELTPDRVKRSPFEGGVRVPLIVVGPEVGRPGTVSEALVHLVDVSATLADLAGLDPDTLGLDGRSFLPYVRDPDLPGEREVLFTEFFGPNGPPPYEQDLRTVRDPRWKLVVDEVAGTEQLYDLAGRVFEGEDLVPLGLDAEQQAARDRLADTLADVLAETPYEGP